MNYVPDFRCVNRPIPVLVAGIAMRLACQKAKMLWNCQASRSALDCDGDNLRPTALTFDAVSFLFFSVLMVSLTPPAVYNIYILYQLNALLMNSVTSLLLPWIRLLLLLFRFLLPFLSISVWVKDSDWSIDQAIEPLEKVRREKGLAKLLSIVLRQTWRMRNVCMFSGRLCCLCNLLINHTQRCLPTLALHLSWRTAFLCVSAQARIDETSKQKEDMTRRTNKYNANGSKESMRRKSRSSAMRKLLVVVVLVRHAKKKNKAKRPKHAQLAANNNSLLFLLLLLLLRDERK